jgi:hypothetical protein
MRFSVNIDQQAQSDWRRDHTFRRPERVPWSELGPQFAVAFGNADPADPQPEHIEIIGQNGSGKTHLLGKIYQERAFVQQRPSVIVATKPADETLRKIGFPVVNNWDQLVQKVRDGEQNVIFWPRTNRMGNQRRHFHEGRIADLLDRLWRPSSDTDIAVDDWGYSESLGEVKARLEQYLREGRSSGISVAAMKQRPQGSTRLMSSETHWTAAFAPKDRADLERWSELFGAKRDWMPVFDSMNPMKREFLLRHNRTKDAYISWVDTPLEPVELPKRRRGLRSFLGG